jgi:hypothetical protein
MKYVKPPKNWLKRWWSPDPRTAPDLRNAPRESLPGLAAYYWTGAAPKAHNIKDISTSGLYVVTEERWYPGTLILMTLQTDADGEESLETCNCRALQGRPLGQRRCWPPVHPPGYSGGAQWAEPACKRRQRKGTRTISGAAPKGRCLGADRARSAGNLSNPDDLVLKKNLF